MLSSLGQDCCGQEANWVLYRVDKFGRAKIFSLLVLEERGAISASLSAVTDMKIHPTSKCVYNQLHFQLREFSILFFPSPLAICMGGRCVGASTSPQAGCPASRPAPRFSPRVTAPLPRACRSLVPVQGCLPCAGSCSVLRFLEHICKEPCHCSLPAPSAVAA